MQRLHVLVLLFALVCALYVADAARIPRDTDKDADDVLKTIKDNLENAFKKENLEKIGQQLKDNFEEFTKKAAENINAAADNVKKQFN